MAQKRSSLLRDESGAVIVEFVVVSPFLLLMFSLVLLFTELNQFQISAQQLSVIQSWRNAGNNTNSGKASDMFGVRSTTGSAFLNSALLNSKSSSLGEGTGSAVNEVLGPVLEEAKLRRMLVAYPNIRAVTYPGIQNQDQEEALGQAAAHFIYSSPTVDQALDGLGNSNFLSFENAESSLYATPWDVMGMPRNTFETAFLDPTELDEEETLEDQDWEPTEEGFIAYRNESFLSPVRTLVNGFIGESGENEDAGDFLELLEISYPTRMPIMHDSYSAYWKEEDPRDVTTLTRIRAVDRMTVLRMPLYTIPMILQTLMSGNILVFSDLIGTPSEPGILNDAGLLPDILGELDFASGIFDNEAFTTLGNLISGAGHTLEAAQPLRKVDKDHRFEHDVEGLFRDPVHPDSSFFGSFEDFDTGPTISEKHRLEELTENKEIRSMVQ